jgi:hypothetical protein
MARLKEQGQRVTAENANELFVWYEDYGVLVCTEHGYAVQNVGSHLRTYHSGNMKEKRAIADIFTKYNIREPKDVSLPPPLGMPIPALGKPQAAFVCYEPECQYISINRKGIRVHCNKNHDWKSSRGQPEHWNRAWVQTFFKSAGLQRYFTVLYDEEDLQADGVETAPLVVSTGDGALERAAVGDDNISLITADWKKQNEKLDEKLETAEASTAKTDHDAWLTRTEWPSHLKGCNLRHLSQASRLPNKEERTMLAVVKLNSTLIEKCVRGLASLDKETRRWLRSAKHAEIDQRPLARLQNVETQQTYATYMARLLCYSLRVLHSREEHERVRDIADEQLSDDADEGSNYVPSDDPGSDRESDGRDSDNEDFHVQHVVDVYKDARRLYPWHGDQRHLLKRVRDSIEDGWDEKAQLDALLKFYNSLIFQHVRGDTFQSAILHFLAVLGIDTQARRFRSANDFSYTLAGVLYCIRVIAVETILPSDERETQNDSDDERFRHTRDTFLADGTYSVVSKLLSLLAYGKHVAMNHNNAGSVSWSDDRMEMSYKGNPISVLRFGAMARGVIEDAEDKLWRDLLWSTREERFEVPLDKLRDDVT